ncbi:o-succinylbenzoate--CoA ligase [Mycolicibacterium litorale]|uniref:O-succinylbenzoic acid--CoA ligase n=1 Tax=Mycolicibacterium litorale TaxID=758802 RepID=A0AAD1IQQ4_9MYCO|nr:o-succinylbenzoate--CoA ligase [Mycolicibacterium litorale]MCV7416629.1 o-succinylbenzoate--CoA ligase [Mycolicibacterium litorale]TDY09882.1 O-succinylbenzoic acid--CoA ligase [Mycolicibacterium litorale]BBY17842.1 O-succinylbenzoic acid--CoA ligase [Mycolicibacterium litorale]
MAVPSGAAALEVLSVVEDVVAGRGPALLPTPAADADESARLGDALRVGAPIADDVAFVVPTSGTTGTPKGAMLTAAALTASADATHRRLGGAGRWLLALPAHHIAGLQVLVRSVVAGERPVAVAAGFGPDELVSAAAVMGSGRRYVSLVSVQLDKVLRSPDATAALATFDAVLIGGGPIPPGLAERALAAGISVVRTYGMSETAGGCVYDGVPLDGVRVRLDRSRVLLGGPTLAKGYRNPVQPDPFAEPGWFRTDDVGALDGGVLRVLGRADDAISTGGLTVMPPLVEAVLSRHPAIADCAVFGVADERLGQRVVAAIVVAPGASAPTVAELRAHVAEELDATAAPREVHVVDEVPRRGIGKVDRRALSARFG